VCVGHPALGAPAWQRLRDLVAPNTPAALRMAGTLAGGLPPFRLIRAMLAESPSILITDDDRAFRETLKGVFVPKGFRTLLAADGEEALQIVHAETVHLVLLDFHMPKLTGLETLRKVKQYRSLLPCILISANLDDVTRQQARQADVFSVLSKPVSVSQLTRVVREAMRQIYDWPSPN